MTLDQVIYQVIADQKINLSQLKYARPGEFGYRMKQLTAEQTRLLYQLVDQVQAQCPEATTGQICDQLFKIIHEHGR